MHRPVRVKHIAAVARANPHRPSPGNENRIIEPKHKQSIGPAVEGNIQLQPSIISIIQRGKSAPLGRTGKSSAEARIDLDELNLPLRRQETLHGNTTHCAGRTSTTPLPAAISA